MPIAPRSKCVLILGRRPRNCPSLWCRSLGVATFELQEPFVTSSVKSSGGSTRVEAAVERAGERDGLGEGGHLLAVAAVGRVSEQLARQEWVVAQRPLRLLVVIC